MEKTGINGLKKERGASIHSGRMDFQQMGKKTMKKDSMEAA